jgi:hypothetical protein
MTSHDFRTPKTRIAQLGGALAQIATWTWRVRKTLAVFCLGALSSAAMILVVQDSKTTAVAATKGSIRSDGPSNSTSQDRAPKGDDHDHAPQEMSQQQLRQYIDWAQQMNLANLQPGGMSPMSNLASLPFQQASHGRSNSPLGTQPLR